MSSAMSTSAAYGRRERDLDHPGDRSRPMPLEGADGRSPRLVHAASDDDPIMNVIGIKPA
jgi:hypothetical protein